MSDGYGCALVVVIAGIVGVVGVERGCSKGPVPVATTTSRTVSMPVAQKVANVFKKDKVKVVETSESEQGTAPVEEAGFEAPDFTFGTIPFWILAVLVVIGTVVCVEYEQGVVGALCLLGFLGIVQWAGTSNPLEYVKRNPLDIALFVACYYVVGVVWGFIKWYLFLIDKKTDLIEFKAKWLEDNGASDPAKITEALKQKWSAQIYKFAKPTARTNKSKIIHWISFWPVSMVWSLLDDFVKRVGKMIYNHIASLLQAVSDRVWKDVNHDLI